MRVGVVGCGFQGDFHLQAFGELPDVEVVAVCDVDLERADALGRRYGVDARYASHEELLGRHELDLVTVCTMPDTHLEIVGAALARGAHVLCEKPIALNAADAATMTRAAAGADRRLFVGFNMRHMQSVRAIRQFLEAGELGAPICARGWMLAGDVPWWGRHYSRRLSGGGALASTAVHMIDLVWWLTGRPQPLTATASAATVFPRKRGAGKPEHVRLTDYDVEDLIFGHVRFAGGLWLTIEGAWVWDAPGWNYGFELVGDAGQAATDPLRLVGERQGEVQELTDRYAADGAPPIAEDFPTSVRAEIAEVVGAIRAPGGATTTPSGAEGVVVQSIVDALYLSAERQAEVAVAVPDVGSAYARESHR